MLCKLSHFIQSKYYFLALIQKMQQCTTRVLTPLYNNLPVTNTGNVPERTTEAHKDTRGNNSKRTANIDNVLSENLADYPVTNLLPQPTGGALAIKQGA